MAMGRFADLSSYRRAVDEPTASPLDSLLQGYQQGRAIRKIPQDDVMNQIQLQLAQAKLRDALNPEEATARKIKEQIQMNLAEKSGQLGTGIFPSDINEPVGTPKAISPLQEAAITQGGIDPDSLNLPKAGSPITPVMFRGQPTGFAIDPDKALSEQESLSKSKGSNAYDIAQLRNEMAMQQLSNKIDEGQKNRDSREKIAATRGGNNSYVNPKDYNDIIQIGPGEKAPEGYVPAKTYFEGQRLNQMGSEHERKIQDSKNKFVKSLSDQDLKYLGNIQKLEPVKDYNQAKFRSDNIEKALELGRQTGDYTIVDNALIENVNRLMTNQAVRQQAYERVKKDQPAFQRLKGFFETGLTGGSITDQTRDDIYNLSKIMLDTAAKNSNAAIENYKPLIGDDSRFNKIKRAAGIMPTYGTEQQADEDFKNGKLWDGAQIIINGVFGTYQKPQ